MKGRCRLALYSGVSFALCCSEAGDGGGAGEPGPDRPAASLAADGRYLGRTLYAFTDTEDAMPSQVVLTNARGRVGCSLVFPGNTPITGADSPIVCTAAGPNLIAEASYPPTPLPPRTPNSPLAPSAPPAPTGTCDADHCTTGPADWNSAPPNPYVYFDIRAKDDDNQVQLSITGNGRDVNATILLTVDPSQVYYFHVDEARAR